MWLFIIMVYLSQRSFSSEDLLEKSTVESECFLNVSELISYHGYSSEEHHVETEDKYILTVYRMHPRKNNDKDNDPKPVVFLQHSLLGDATHWISNSPNNSFGFILADAGYDVWLGNSRGNAWSLHHKTLEPTDQKFWEFSFHEMGNYDLPAVIYYILNETRQEQLYYVGHSEGSTSGFIAFSTRPELAERIKVFFALGPVTAVPHVTTPAVILAHFSKGVLEVILGTKQVLRFPAYLTKLFVKFCNYQPGFCANVLGFVCGYNIPNMSKDRLAMYIARNPAGTSLQNFLHWTQMIFKKHFTAYDYGSQEKNMQKYNQTTPPAYKIEDIKIPIVFWTGGRDLFSNLTDVAFLRSKISNLVSENHIPEWQHLDFIWGLDATERMYMKIIETMKRYT